MKAIVFDIGNVLLYWDPRFLFEPLFEGDNKAMETFLSDVCSIEWNEGMDAGRDWDEAIAERIRAYPDQERMIRAFRSRWHEMVPGPIQGSIDILEALHVAGHPIYGLTNFAADTFEETRQKYDFFSLFQDIAVSGIEKIIKPDPRFYRCLLDRNALKPEDCIFIDDNPANIGTGAALGMDAILFRSPAQLHQALTNRGLISPAVHAAAISA
ncbi:HAD family hydrolase [Coralliovum pocilloporae]|uniref:HAD family hydrolase n=1 Tax=Coralliovum pocilloporae TaxID=3066369 RepID=UPI00330735C9